MARKKLPTDSLFFSRTSDFLDAFLVGQCNKSEKTRESYRDALTIFKRYVLNTGHTMLDFRYADCTYNYLLEYKEYLSSVLHYAPSSVNQRLAAVKSYLKYSCGCDSALMQTYICADAVPFSKVPKIQRETLAEDEVANLLASPPATRKGLRDTLIMSMLFDAAIRLDELVRLKAGDIYKRDGTTYLLIHGKGNKERKVSLDSKTAALLDLYLKEYHHKEGKNGNVPLIYTVIKGEIRYMSHRNIQKILKKYSETVSSDNGTAPKAHPHLLRRSRASNLYQNGVPIEIISRFLGHSSVETTKDHYAYPSMEQLRQATNAGAEDCEGKETPLWLGHEDELAKMCGLR